MWVSAAGGALLSNGRLSSKGRVLSKACLFSSGGILNNNLMGVGIS